MASQHEVLIEDVPFTMYAPESAVPARKRIAKSATDLERIPVDASQRVAGLAYSVGGVAIVIWREGGPWFLSGDSKAAICEHGRLCMDCKDCAASRRLLLEHPWFNAEDQARTLAAYDAKVEELLAAGDSMIPENGPLEMNKIYVSDFQRRGGGAANVLTMAWSRRSRNSRRLRRACVHGYRLGYSMCCLSYYRCHRHNQLFIDCPACIKLICLHGILRSQCNQCRKPCLISHTHRSECRHCLDIEVGLPDAMRKLPIMAPRGKYAVKGRVYRQWVDGAYAIVTCLK